ncbi:hypothetical protein F5Y12DRAFT_790299 [Xylaria sp. FL1777]|nr:hypothetical protein F5Y12DRAFT_790299 [Xylaria sp. FL1777]
MDVDDSDTPSQPDQYARDNCLSIDSQIDPFSLVFQINDSVPQLTPDAGPSGLTSDSCLLPLHLPTLGLMEQLDVSEECSGLVVQALQYDDIKVNCQYDNPLAQYEARKRLSSLKLDLPALSSDPDYDSRELAGTIQDQRQPSISPEMFPLERLNIANDEGLEFPISTRRFGQEFDCMVRHEKLDVPKETIHHLARALQDDWSGDDQRKVFEEEMPRRTVRSTLGVFLYLLTHILQLVRDLAITPPLSPYTEHEEQFIPDAEVCEVPIEFDSCSMLSDDVKASESVILRKEFEKDVPLAVDIGTPVLSPLLDPPTLDRKLPKISSFRVESPLSPITSPLRSTNEESTDIPALLRSMDIDRALSHPKFSEMVVLKTDSRDLNFDHNLDNMMKEHATAVLKSIEQERINIADAVARVEVPILDFSIREPEWRNLPMDSRAHLKWVCQSYNITIPPCSRESRTDLKLRWVPFSRTTTLSDLTKEAIDFDESRLSQHLIFPEAKEIPTSGNYVWKRPGLAILRELESEDDLECIASLANVKPDIASLARKRRFENSAKEIGTSLSRSSNESVDLIVPFQHRKSSQHTSAEHLIGSTSLLPGMESNSAVSTLLSNYINIRTAKRRKHDKSLFFLPTSGPQVELKLVSTPKSSQPKGNSSSLSSTVERIQKKATLPSPCPGMTIQEAPTKIIKGLTLSRGLFSTLEQLYPTAEIIERDFGCWDTTTQNYQPALRPTVISSLATEADIIVSPATGIVLTTLLKVIQKPLRARGGQSSIRERITHVALRYERLIVLVSEGNTVDETVRDLTPSEASAYAEFIIFVAGLDSHIEVFYVGGGEATLARWLVSFAVRYAPEATETQAYLTQRETKWEVFLRRAGFNAYAAQAILVRLKARSNTHTDKSEYTKHGLAAFMKMTDVERMQSFRDLMGGESVLNRVNQTLRTTWI